MEYVSSEINYASPLHQTKLENVQVVHQAISFRLVNASHHRLLIHFVLDSYQIQSIAPLAPRATTLAVTESLGNVLWAIGYVPPLQLMALENVEVVLHPILFWVEIASYILALMQIVLDS
jgi:hypothetical protein